MTVAGREQEQVLATQQSGAGPTKATVRPHVQQPLGDVPRGNLLVLYLEACKQHGVTAQTAVARKLLLRARAIQPLPFHRLSGIEDDQTQLLQRCVQHLMLSAVNGGRHAKQERLVRLHTALNAAAIINPLMGQEEVLQAVELCEADLPTASPGVAANVSLQRFVTEAQLRAMLSAAAQRVPLPELQQAVLEVLAHYEAPSEALGGSTPDHLAHLLAAHVDLTDEGRCLAEDLHALLLKCHRAASGASDPSGQNATHAPMPLPPLSPEHQALLALRGDTQVDLSSVQQLLLAMFEQNLKPSWVFDVINTRIRDEFCHDLGRQYLGPQGVLPLLPALVADVSCSQINLSRNGLNCKAVEALCAALKGHPSLTRLDLSHNPVADRGGLALATLLSTNRRIVQLDLTGTHLMRPSSRTHHNSLGPSPCEDGGKALAALALNRRLARHGPAELARQLLDHDEGLKSIVYSLMTPGGGTSGGSTVPLEALVAELREVAVSWGYEPQVVDTLMDEARAASHGPVQDFDDTGTLPREATHVTWPQLKALLRKGLQKGGGTALIRVATAVRHHRASVKKAFYALLANQTATAGELVQGVRTETQGDQEGAETEATQDRSDDSAPESTPPAAVWLSELLLVLEQLATQERWQVSMGDVTRALCPALFANSRRPAGVPQPTEATATDTRLTWPAFINRVLSVLV